jgi:glycolate oxidase FAD binding subunit
VTSRQQAQSADLHRLYSSLPSDRILDVSGSDWAVDGMEPVLAVRPASIDEVSTVLQISSEHGLAVIPWGGGGLMDLGNLPARYEVALDLTGLDAVVEYSPDDLVVRAQAGMTIGALNRHLAERGQFLALDTPLADRATIGGALSANLPGPARLRYGTARDLVIGMTCVLSSGRRVHSGGRVVKNVAGYDLNKLYLGAVGTLGVIVEASFKLHPLPPSRAAIAAGFRDFAAAHAAGLAIANSSLGAAALEIAGKGVAGRLSPAAGAGHEALLLISLVGLPRAVERQTEEIAANLQHRNALATTALDEEEGPPILAAVRDLGRAKDSAALMLRCNLLPADLPSALDRLEEALLLEQAAVTASPGAGNLRLAWFQPPEEPLALIEAIRREVRTLSGNVIVERCPAGLKQSVDVWGVEGPDVRLMRDMKAAYDPTGTLSPGRFISRL